MPEIVVTTRQGQVVHIDAEVGFSVMESIRNAGVDEILALCGGCCACATCHVHVDGAFVDRVEPISENEDQLLSTSDHRLATSRLSCMLVMNPALDGLRVTIAPED
jgi:2Fe-2S ferredoxin